MRNIPARQVHLDFHTSPKIPGVGSAFSKKQFQTCLKEGNVGSITVFAKCHHGYCYYPTGVGTPHPTMEPGFDLTGQMIEACHEIGVAAPVYITAGWSAMDARNHPEWISLDETGKPCMLGENPDISQDTPKPICSWTLLCLNGPYAEYLYDLTREVVDRYDDLDGLFYDICFMTKTCYCKACRDGMKKLGFDSSKKEDAERYFRLKRMEFMKKTAEILHEKHPDATIFFNGGAEIRMPEYLPLHSHLEMEDLPTTWGGYNKMPPRASLMARTGKEVLGMTGKFHTTWGEFGGYKHPDALKYEALTMAMYGAKCSVGDQMLPVGLLDEQTYRNIGVAFRALEALEPWSYPSASTAKVAVYLSGNEKADSGLHAILLEGHIDFDVILPGDALSAYALVILPDCVQVSEEEAARLSDYAARGGHILFGYESAVKDGKLLLDCGAEFVSDAVYDQDYLKPGAEVATAYADAPFLCYRAAKRVKLTDGKSLADVYDPYFSRTYGHYCSHMNTPYANAPSGFSAVSQKDNVIYYAHPLCSMYEVDGAQVFRDTLLRLISCLISPTYQIELPSAGRSCLRYQKEKNRYVFHATYASPMQRGRTLVIEDMVPLYEVPVSIRMEQPTAVRTVPDGKELDFCYENGLLSFRIPKILCHQIPKILCHQAVEICLVI